MRSEMPGQFERFKNLPGQDAEVAFHQSAVSNTFSSTSIQLIRIDKKPCWGRNREFHSTELVAYQQLAYQDNLERTRCPESPGVAFLRV